MKKWMLAAAAVLFLSLISAVFIYINTTPRLDEEGDADDWINARYMVEEFRFAGYQYLANGGKNWAKPVFNDKNNRLCTLYTSRVLGPFAGTAGTDPIRDDIEITAENIWQFFGGGKRMAFTYTEDWEIGEIVLINCSLENAYYNVKEKIWYVPMLGACLYGRKNGKPIHYIHDTEFQTVTGRFMGIQEHGVIKRPYPHMGTDLVTDYFTASESEIKELLKDSVDYLTDYTDAGFNEYDSCNLLAFETENGIEYFYCADNILSRNTEGKGYLYHSADEFPYDKKLQLYYTESWYFNGAWQKRVFFVKDAE